MSGSSGNQRYLVGGAAAACAVCCAPPVLALVGIAGAGTVVTVATFAFAGLVFALVVAVTSTGAFVLRKRVRDPRLAPDGPRQDSEPLPHPVRRGSPG